MSQRLPHRDPLRVESSAIAPAIAPKLERSRQLSIGTFAPDSLYFLPEKWRLPFFDPTVFAAAQPLTNVEILRPCLYIDHFFAPELGEKLAHKLSEATVLLSRYAADSVRTAFERRGHRVITIADEGDFAPAREASQFCSTDPAALKLVPGIFVAPSLEFMTLPSIARQRLFLYKGEDENPLLLRELLAGVPAFEPPLRIARPLISIVVPVYDRTTEILRLADSIAAQRYPALEVIFVCNGSPTETKSAVTMARATLMRSRIKPLIIDFEQAFGCATVPRDVGSFAARGEFICYIDTDDYFAPGFFDVFNEEVRTDTIYYPKKIFRNGGRNMGKDFAFDVPLAGRGDFKQGLYEALRMHGNFFNNSGVAFPRQRFVNAGGILHGFRYCEDYYLWLRLAKLGARAKEHSGCVNIVLHPGNNELEVSDPVWIERAKRAAEREVVW